MPINWALNPAARGLVRHTATGSLSLVPGGTALVNSDGDASRRLRAARIAHGVLMTFAFVLCFPMGALTARHKWGVGPWRVS